MCALFTTCLVKCSLLVTPETGRPGPAYPLSSGKPVGLSDPERNKDRERKPGRLFFWGIALQKQPLVQQGLRGRRVGIALDLSGLMLGWNPCCCSTFFQVSFNDGSRSPALADFVCGTTIKIRPVLFSAGETGNPEYARVKHFDMRPPPVLLQLFIESPLLEVCWLTYRPGPGRETDCAGLIRRYRDGQLSCMRQRTAG